MTDLRRLVKLDRQNRYELVSSLQCILDSLNENDAEDAKLQVMRAYEETRRIRSNFEELLNLTLILLNDAETTDRAYADGWRDGIRDFWARLTTEDRSVVLSLARQMMSEED